MRSFTLFASAVVLALTNGAVHAYQIVEGKYRVETSPGVFQDQLVVRCEDGRQLTLPWETKLREACGESLMGAEMPQPIEAAAAPAPARPASPSVPDFGTSFEVQKRMLLTRLRVQSGDVPEQLVSFEQRPDGLVMHHAPALSAVLKQFETCREARGSDCVAVRNAAYARLRATDAAAAAAVAPASVTAAQANQPPHTAPPTQVQPAKAGRPAASKSNAKPVAVRPSKAVGHAPSQAQGDEWRAMMENEIAEQYKWCVRSKPKEKCEQARARALGRLTKAGAVRSGGQPAAPARVSGALQS
jgi:hypothetical protein